MITLAALARLAQDHPEALEAKVAPVRIGDRQWSDEPVLMATVNLSRDSTYRESIATGIYVVQLENAGNRMSRRVHLQ